MGIHVDAFDVEVDVALPSSRSEMQVKSPSIMIVGVNLVGEGRKLAMDIWTDTWVILLGVFSQGVVIELAFLKRLDEHHEGTIC